MVHYLSFISNQGIRSAFQNGGRSEVKCRKMGRKYSVGKFDSCAVFFNVQVVSKIVACSNDLNLSNLVSF